MGKIYEKCIADERIRNANIKIAFDLEGGFVNYEGSGLLSHYHEAAYDAYMTGFAFANVMKLKEFDKGRPPKGILAPVVAADDQKQVKGKRVNLRHEFAVKHHNKIMLSQYAKLYFNFDPSQTDEPTLGDKDPSMTVWVQVETQDEAADKSAHLFTEYGDFNLYKDSTTSFFMEFYYMEPTKVPSQTVDEFISIVGQKPVKGVKKVVPYRDAVKFKAHKMLE